MDFLDKNICLELRKVVNSSPIFYRDELEKANYHLICAVMDRIDDSVKFLNQYDYTSQNANDIMLFMIHSCSIVDAVKRLFAQLNINDKEKETKKYFTDIYKNEPLSLNENNYPTDIIFFEYLRALIFAHPFETSHANFLKDKNEIHYSPFLLTEDNNSQKECIGIMVYSNRQTETITLYIPYDTLEAFINSRYKMLILAKNELEKRIENKNEDWKKNKINRNQSDILILQEILNTLKERFKDTYDTEFLLNILKYKSENLKNMSSVQAIKDFIMSSVSEICDGVDNLDYTKLSDIIDKIIYAYPKHTYQMLNYEIGKIFSYLNDGINKIDKQWGLTCAYNFSQQFAKKWVDIDIENMDYDEIKLLVITACYLERQAEKEKEDNIEQN